MGTFNTKATLSGSSDLIPAIADRICTAFAADGYEVNRENLMSGGVDISVTKGGLFKAALGMKTALKITLIPQGNDSIAFDAGVGIFGQQVVPTIIMWFFAWPVLITQIWGMVQQSKLDDKALAIAQSVVAEHGAPYRHGAFDRPAGGKFCTGCGSPLPPGGKFCPNCGAKVL